jgi:hypothetical protein
MCMTVAEAQAHALGLLLAGYSPEEVELALEGRVQAPEPLTALTDPTNVLLTEVNEDGTSDSARTR